MNPQEKLQIEVNTQKLLSSGIALGQKTECLINGEPVKGAYNVELEMPASGIVKVYISRLVLDADGNTKLNADKTDVQREILVFSGKIELKVADAVRMG